jgi:MFS family permease
VASLVALVLILPLAALSDRIGRRPMLIGGALGFAVRAYPFFLLLNSGSIAAAIAAHCGLAVIESVYISAAVVAGSSYSPPGCATAAFHRIQHRRRGVRRHDTVCGDTADR